MRGIFVLPLFDVKHLPVFPSHVPVLLWEYCSTLAGKLQYSHGETAVLSREYWQRGCKGVHL